jgi:type IV secretory pathway component VirB8
MNHQQILLHQSTLREARRWQLMSFVLICVVSLLVISIVVMMPLKTTQVRYVEFIGTDKKSFRIMETPFSKEQKLLILRRAIRGYVINRVSYTGSVHIDTPAVKEVVAMSSPEVTEEFKKVYLRISTDTTIERREVEIISDIPIGQFVHQVEYKTIDHFGGQTFENQWTATIEYKLEKQITNEDDEMLNPYGLVVTKFIEAKKKLSADDLNQILQ